MSKHRSILLLPFLALTMCMRNQSKAFASEVAIVLSSDSSPYQEALDGFQEAYGKPVDVFSLAKGEPRLMSDTRVIVAIGGKAALYQYFGKIPLIYCLAPGLTVTEDQHEGTRINIHASVAMPALVQNLKEIQPTLKKLAVFWMSDSIHDYFDKKEDVSRMGVILRSERLETLANLPDRLRALRGQVDAIWMAPDPLIMTPQSFATVKEFSISNAIPLYVPMDNLVDKGASAAVSTSFREIGRTAAIATQQTLSGEVSGTQSIYPQKSSLTLNPAVAAQSGLTFSPAVINKADRVVR